MGRRQGDTIIPKYTRKIKTPECELHVNINLQENVVDDLRHRMGGNPGWSSRV